MIQLLNGLGKRLGDGIDYFWVEIGDPASKGRTLHSVRVGARDKQLDIGLNLGGNFLNDFVQFGSVDESRGRRGPDGM